METHVTSGLPILRHMSHLAYQYWDTCLIWLTNIETHVISGWILRMSTISCLGDIMTFRSPGQHYSHVMQVLSSLRFEVCKLFTFQFFTKPLDTIKPKRTDPLEWPVKDMIFSYCLENQYIFFVCPWPLGV